MAYNFTQAFLIEHRDLLEQLTALADNGNFTTFKAQNPEHLDKMRYLINNLLTSFARWNPNQAYVRQRVRTWITHDGEHYLLNVGIPPATVAVRGRRADPIVFNTVAHSAQDLLIREEITETNVSDVLLRILAIRDNPDYTTITILQPPSKAGIDYIAERLPNFEVTQDQPLTFTRKGNDLDSHTP